MALLDGENVVVEIFFGADVAGRFAFGVEDPVVNGPDLVDGDGRRRRGGFRGTLVPGPAVEGFAVEEADGCGVRGGENRAKAC